MLSIGGRNPIDDNGNTVMSKDTAVHGLQLFDVSSITWKDSYDANAPAYGGTCSISTYCGIR